MSRILLLCSALLAAQTPALRMGVSVKMPVTMNAAAVPGADEADSLVVAVTASGAAYLEITRLTPAELTDKLKGALAGRPEKRVYVKVDARTSCSVLSEVLAAVRVAGVAAPILLTDQRGANETSYAPPKGLEVRLTPPAPGARSIRAGDGQLTDAEMRQQAQAARSVVMQADGKTPFGDLVHAIDVCVSAGATIYLATSLSAQMPLSPLQEPWAGVPEGFRRLPVGKLDVPGDLASWQARRADVKRIVVNSLGEMPPRPSPAGVKVISVDRKTGWRIEKFEFQNGVDSRVPGYIAIPEDGRQRHPATLTMHGHSSSKENMFGYQPTSQDVAALLVKNGYVVLGIDNYFNGERKGAGPAGDLETMQRGSDQEASLFKLNLWLGRTLWGMMLRDELIALDYLASRPEVDPERIGAQGMSMGSTRAWWLAAIDDRVKAVVGVACFTRYEDLIAIRQLKAHGIYYFVPGLLKHFDSEGVMALLAPRPFLALTGDRDEGSPPEGMKKLELILSKVYGLYGKADSFRSVIYPETGHVYTDDQKEKMVAWFNRHLGGGPR